MRAPAPRPRAPRLIVQVLLGLFIALGLLTPVASPAAAHVRASSGYSQISQQGSVVSYRLDLEYELLARAVGFHAAVAASESDAKRASALRANAPKVEEYLYDRLRLNLDGARCEQAVRDTGLTQRDGLTLAVLNLEFDCHGATSGRYAVHYEVFRDTDAVVDDHTNIVDYSLGGHTDRVVLDRSHTSFETGETDLAATLTRFVGMGFEHILSGLDHVLFVLALVVGARDAKSLVKVVSVFTLAHSVTLAFAALGWVHIPPSVVEPLIALSIAFVAFDALLGGQGHRLLAVFAFGLLHGLGFAGALTVEGGSIATLVTSLLSFNVGIEVGQLLVILCAVPVLFLLRRAKIEALASIAAGLVIGAVGLFWFAERVIANTV